jgi:hypothetical protein
MVAIRLMTAMIIVAKLSQNVLFESLTIVSSYPLSAFSKMSALVLY